MNVAAGFGMGLALAAEAAGVGLIRWGWRRPRARGGVVAGWALLGAAIPAWAAGGGWDRAAALALLVPSPMALSLVAAGWEARSSRSRRAVRTSTELPDRSGETKWRAWVRALYGGPLAGLAALPAGAAWVLHGPGPETDRLGTALIGVPILWAGGLIWSTTDPKLVRIGGGLGAAALAGVLAAAL